MAQSNENEDRQQLDPSVEQIDCEESQESAFESTAFNTAIGRLFTILPNSNDMKQLNEDVMYVWLDDTIGTSVERQWFIDTHQLRQTISHIQIFYDIKDCINCIDSTGIERTFLIVAGNYGNNFDMKLFQEIIHNVFIYILSSDEFEFNGGYPNIRGCFKKIDTLIDQLVDDSMVYKANTTSDVNSNTMNTNESIAYFINPQEIQWKCMQLTTDILHRMPYPRQQSMDRLIEYCASTYKNNASSLAIIEKFRHTYNSDNAIYWYTKVGFLYRQLIKNMRTNDVDMTVAFSFFITDLYNQMNTLRIQQSSSELSSIVCYRGQQISSDELVQLKLKVGEFISINGMLSTSLNRQMELRFAAHPEVGYGFASVLFEVAVDLTSSAPKPYADISDLSSFRHEKEVLFAHGHIFRIDSCELTADNFWIIKLTLCNNTDSIVQNSADYFDVAMLQLLEILPKISPNTNKANDRLLQRWRLYCENDPSELAKIDQFEHSYRSDSAIRWYTKDSLLYRLLNTALRQNNIDVIIDFRYFIIDLYEQLTKAHVDYVRSFKEETLTVYRGQKLNLLELRRLKHNVGNYISIKSLFSASLSSEVALRYAEIDESDKKQFFRSVLFQIDIDMRRLAQSCKKHIFANITKMSCVFDEDEVLFSINTRFRVESINNWNGTLWIVCLTLENESDLHYDEIIRMDRCLNSLKNIVIQYYGDNIVSLLKNNCLK